MLSSFYQFPFKFYLTILFIGFVGYLPAQNQNMYNGHFSHIDDDFHLYIDFDKGIEVPGFSFLGFVDGYISGKVNGIWLVTTHEVDSEKCVLRLSDDQGSDSQILHLRILNDSTLQIKIIGNHNLKRLQKRKYSKFPSQFQLKRMSNTST